MMIRKAEAKAITVSDKGTYLGLRAVDIDSWYSGYNFASDENPAKRLNWTTINTCITRTIEHGNASASWWAGYGFRWMERDDE